MSNVEMILPYGSDEEKGAQVRRMFDKIARRYDRMNRIMSMGFDKSWRRRSVASLKTYHPETILDIASGTGDLAIMMRKKLLAERIIGADLSEEMMNIGRYKAGRAGVADYVTFEYQDCMSLTYPDNTFDVVTAAFGVRNFENLEQGLAEMRRVLKPGGCIMILELSTPRWFPMNILYKIYSAIIIPFLGMLISLDKQAYRYLPESIKAMPQGNEMIAILTKLGFKDAIFRTYTGGVCSMYKGLKK